MSKWRTITSAGIGLVVAAVVGGLTYNLHQEKKKADPLCSEVKAYVEEVSGGHFKVLIFKNLSPLCMQALGDKVNFQVSDFLTAQFTFGEQSSSYTLTSKGMVSPTLKLKMTQSTIGNSVSFAIGLPVEDADKMLKQKKIKLVPENNKKKIKQLDLAVETLPK